MTSATAAAKPRETLEEIVRDMPRRGCKPGAEPREVMLSHVARAQDRLFHVRQLAWAIDQLTMHVMHGSRDNMDLGECVQHLGILAGEQAELAEAALEEVEATLNKEGR